MVGMGWDGYQIFYRVILYSIDLALRFPQSYRLVTFASFSSWHRYPTVIFSSSKQIFLENGRYGHAPIQSDTSIRVYTMADTDTSTPCVGVRPTCIIRPGRSLRERSLYAMGGKCRPLATNKLVRSVSFMTQQKR